MIDNIITTILIFVSISFGYFLGLKSKLTKQDFYDQAFIAAKEVNKLVRPKPGIVTTPTQQQIYDRANPKEYEAKQAMKEVLDKTNEI